MREGGAGAAAVEIDDMFLLAQREDDTPIESIRPLQVEQADLPQQIEGITLTREMTTQASAGGTTDLEFLDQAGIMQSAPVEIVHRFGVVIELLLIEHGSLLKHVGRVGLWSVLWI